MKRVRADHSRSAMIDGRSAGWRRRTALAAASLRPNELDGMCDATAGPPHGDRAATQAGQRTTQGVCTGCQGRAGRRPDLAVRASSGQDARS
jgi:hypothetical protein